MNQYNLRFLNARDIIKIQLVIRKRHCCDNNYKLTKIF